MEIRTALLQEHSLAQAKKVAAMAATAPEKLRALVSIFLEGDAIITQRAAWALSHYADNYPDGLSPYLSAMIDRCAQPGLPDAARRNVSRILQFATIPENTVDAALNACFTWLEDPQEAIAVRCFSMSAIERLSNGEPELRNALQQSLEYILQYEQCTPAIKSRAGKVLKQLQKDKKKRL
jgi:hypothetical protein